jgi:hypothetical protein
LGINQGSKCLDAQSKEKTRSRVFIALFRFCFMELKFILYVFFGLPENS